MIGGIYPGSSYPGGGLSIALGSISVPFISSTTTVFTPTDSGTGNTNLSAPFISSSTTLYTPVVRFAVQNLPVPFIASSTTIFTPTATGTGSVSLPTPFIAPTTVVYIAATTIYPVLQFIAQNTIDHTVHLVYQVPLDEASVPATTDFHLVINSVTTPVTGVTVSGYEVILTV